LDGQLAIVQTQDLPQSFDIFLSLLSSGNAIDTRIGVE
jgi:hypothetical protein